MNFFISIESIMSILLLSLTGFLLTKGKLLNTSIIPQLTAILMYVCNPVLTFISFQQVDFSAELMQNIAVVFVSALSSFILLFALYFLFFAKKVKSSKEGSSVTTSQKKVMTFAMIFGNVGFMGVPFLQAMFPNSPEPIIYCATFIAVFNMVVFTFGIYILSGDKKFISPIKALTNPATIALTISLVCFIFGLKLEALSPRIFESVKLLGNATTPIAMVILGIKLAECRLKELFNSKRLYLNALVKLIIIPLSLYAIMLLLPIDATVRTVLFIIFAMPTATLTIALGEQHLNEGKFAAILFTNSTLLSMLTVPLLLLLV